MVFFDDGVCFKGAGIAPIASLGIFLARDQAKTAFNFPNHRVTSKNVFPSRTSIRNVFKSTFAGPCVTLPVRTSKRDLCHGHSTSNPLKQPSDNGPKRCVQNS